MCHVLLILIFIVRALSMLLVSYNVFASQVIPPRAGPYSQTLENVEERAVADADADAAAAAAVAAPSAAADAPAVTGDR